MATEDKGLVRRNPAASTLHTMFDADAATPDRVIAGGKVAAVAAAGTTGAILGIDALALHASSLIGSVWSAGEVGLLAGGAAAGVGIIATAVGRANENDASSDVRKAHYRAVNRSFFRGVGAAGLSVGGALALVGAGLASAHGVGLTDMSQAGSVFFHIAEGSAAVGLVGAGLGGFWNRRMVQAGQLSLGE